MIICVWRNHARIFKKCIIYRNLLKKVLQNSWKKSLFLLFFLRLDLFPQAPPAWVVRWSKGRILSKLSLFFLFLLCFFCFWVSHACSILCYRLTILRVSLLFTILSKIFKGNSTWKYFCIELEWYIWLTLISDKMVGKKLYENG